MAWLWTELRQDDHAPIYFELLETRWCMASTAAAAVAVPLSNAMPMTAPAAEFANELGYSPQQIRAAYGFDQITFTTSDGQQIQGDGTGQTIAIIVAYHHPNIAEDFSAFNAAFGLPDTDGQGNFALVQRTMGTDVATDPLWALEASLDVQWAHAMAPGARILLVEAASDKLTDMFVAVNWARQQRGVVAVSMSWGTDEFRGQSVFDPLFQTPVRQGRSREIPGVTFVAASGDLGAPAGYPATSPNVLAVGGTTLLADLQGNRLQETGWSYSGGGQSIIYTDLPDRQLSLNAEWIARATPDVAFNADPDTGFPAYCSISDETGYFGWYQVGGTSVGTPPWAALIAIANQGRKIHGLGAMDGATQTLPALYAMDPENFHDILVGDNGYQATAGFDLVTGLGSPIANRIADSFLSVPDRNVTNAIAGMSILNRPMVSSGSNTSTPQTVTVIRSVVTEESAPELQQSHKALALTTMTIVPENLGENRERESATAFGDSITQRLRNRDANSPLRLAAIDDALGSAFADDERDEQTDAGSGNDRLWWNRLLNQTEIHLTVRAVA